MGLLRLLHAIAVIIAHSTPIFGMPLVGGVGAVQTFYMVSGFYMTLILETKYVGSGSYRLFLVNRFLRLFPIYWVILLLTVVAAVVARLSIGHWVQLEPFVAWRHQLSGFTWFYLLGTNLAIVGQDWLLFMGLNPETGRLFFTPNFLTLDPPIYGFLPIFQAWSIGVEISFYLLAPFIVRRSVRQVSLLILISLSLRAVIYYELDWHFDPWTYRFFPTELAFFLFGTLAYRLYEWLKQRPLPQIIPWIGTLLILGLTVLYPILPAPWGNEELKLWTHYALILVGLPFAFLASANSKIDRWLGELSYPVYMAHGLIITSLRLIPGVTNLGLSEGTLTLLISLAAAWLLKIGIADPVEKIRQSRIERLQVPTDGHKNMTNHILRTRRHSSKGSEMIFVEE
ncbi:MAG: acyltransferase [Caldilineaceae bacterium]